MFGVIVNQIIVEHIAPAKNTGILSIQAEHETDAERVEALQRVLICRILVLLDKRIIELSDYVTGLDGNLHLM